MRPSSPENIETETPADDCRLGQPFSLQRFLVLTMVFIAMLGSGCVLPFMVSFSSQTYGLQWVSLVTDTAAVILYTFSSNKGGMPPYMFHCPVVRRAIPGLLRRHIGFLFGLFVLETAALRIVNDLPSYWTTASPRNLPPFFVVLIVLCSSLVLTQILTNRSVLATAHGKLADQTQAVPSQLGL